MGSVILRELCKIYDSLNTWLNFNSDSRWGCDSTSGGLTRGNKPSWIRHREVVRPYTLYLPSLRVQMIVPSSECLDASGMVCERAEV